MSLVQFFSTDRGQRASLIALLSVAALAVIALMGYLIWSGYREAIRTAETTSRNYAAIIEARLSATLRRADGNLQELVRTIPIAALSPQAAPRYARELNVDLDTRMINFPELAGLRIFDANGDRIYSSASAKIRPTNVADRGYFRLLRDQPGAGLMFSEVIISRSRGVPSMVAARALRDGQGAFRGIVIATIELDHFQKLFQSLDLGARGLMAIHRSENFSLVVRWPQIDGALNRQLPAGSPARVALAHGNKTATAEYLSATDGIVRIYSVNVLDRYPFFVTAALAREDVLAGWKVRSLVVGLSGLLLLGLLAGLLFRLWRAEARQAQVMSDLTQSERRHRELVATLPGAVYEFRVDAAGRRSMPFISEGIVDLAGLSPTDVMADVEVAFRRVPAHAMPAMEQSIGTALENLSHWLHEFPIRTVSGEDKWLRGHSIPRREADGATSWSGVFVDISARKQAEEARSRLAAIVENASDAIIGRTLDGTITSWNAAAERMFGYSAAEAIGQPVTILRVPGEHSLRVHAENNEKLLRGEALPETEVTRPTKGGRLIDTVTSISPIRNETGQVVGASVIIRDITERKRMERALLEREAWFGAAFEQAAVGMALRDIDPRKPKWQRVNQKLCDILGYTREELLQLTSLDLTPPEDRQTAIDYNEQLRRGEIANYSREKRYVHKDGHIIWAKISLSTVRGTDGRPNHVISVIEDISGRVAAEIERQKSEARFQNLFEFSPDAILMVNEKGCIALANRKAEFLFGYGREEFRNLPVEQLVPEAARKNHAGTRERFLSNPIPRSMDSRNLDLRAQKKDGTTFPAEISLNPIATDDGMLVATTVRDLTDRKFLEARLRQSQKMEAIGTLAGGIAHDFNNILAAISGNAELARQDVGAQHPALASLDEIRKASLRAKDLVSQILTYSQQRPQSRQPVALVPVVEEAVRLLRAILPTGVEITMTSTDDTLRVLADPSQIQQVLLNLSTNAWHALEHDRGRIDISLDGITLDAGNTFHDLRPGRYAHVTVRDTGCGMDAATLERAFEPFFTTKEVGVGTGLGLSVVHGIMRTHEGVVGVESAPGRGTTVHLYFPATEAPARSSAAAPAITAPPSGSGQHVLYLDDEEALVVLVTQLLQRTGYQVSGYTRVESALAAVRADPQRFDLVVTDYNMPGMSGIDVANALARIRPDLPVAITSGYITDELRQEAKRAGVQHLIYKANTVEELCEAVRALTGKAN